MGMVESRKRPTTFTHLISYIKWVFVTSSNKYIYSVLTNGGIQFVKYEKATSPCSPFIGVCWALNVTRCHEKLFHQSDFHSSTGSMKKMERLKGYNLKGAFTGIL